MDVVRLGAYNNINPTYLPDLIVEEYTSMIWTERFLVPGEFEMKTPYVEQTLAILPEKTLISHRHTQEVMMVETHSITTDEFGQEELTVRGHSVDSILQKRFVEGKYQKRRKMAQNYSPKSAALVLLWNSLNNGNTTGDPTYDVSRIRKDGGPDNDEEGTGERWAWNNKDWLPNVSISDSASGTGGDSRRWWLTEGMVYEQLTRILEQGDFGLRTIRPPSATIADTNVPDGYLGERVRVITTLANFGDIERVVVNNYSTLRFDVFNGNDRSSEVVFNVLREDFQKAEHLFSIQEHKTAIEVMSGLNRKHDIYRSSDEAAFTGWDRYVTAMDAGEPDIRPEPDKNVNDYNTKYNKWVADRDRIIDEFEEDYKKDGKKELKRTRKLSAFSGDLSDEGTARYLYKTHYNLGDTVTLVGRRGLSEKAIVTEHVLTEDAEGERGYPGLEIV